LLANTEAMLLTPLTSQPTMLPYVVVAVLGFVTQAVTAVPMLPLMRHVSEQLAPQLLLNPGYAVRNVAPHSLYIAPLLQAESAVVEAKIEVRLVTRSTFQLAKFWLKAAADSNVLPMLDTLAVFQLAKFWLNAELVQKAFAMFVTLAMFHPPILELKTFGPSANM
jgi:hypothetical protein